MYPKTKDDVKRQLIEWSKEIGEKKAVFACAYLIGYHEVITEEMWEAVRELLHEGILDY